MQNAMRHGQRFADKLHYARIWNDAIQCVALTIACNERDPLRPDDYIDGHPCLECPVHDAACAHVVKHLITLKIDHKAM